MVQLTNLGELTPTNSHATGTMHYTNRTLYSIYLKKDLVLLQKAVQTDSGEKTAYKSFPVAGERYLKSNKNR
jgi:hypothetical protein